MHIVPLVVATLFLTHALIAMEIREFSVATLERLGNELSQRDSIAARAADLVAAEHPEFKKVARGWITDLASANRLHMIMQKDYGVTEGYAATNLAARPLIV